MGEEVELRDLVAQTLESNGCLSKIRAQLRANLFLALHEDNTLNKEQPLFNYKIKPYLETSEGVLMFGLVREFLEFFDLDFTISVFDPESYAGSQYRYEGRDKILDDLGLQNGKKASDGPILLELIKIAQTKSRSIQINLTNLNKSNAMDLNNSTHDSSIKETDKENKLNCTDNPKEAVNSTYVINSPNNNTTITKSTNNESENNDDTYNSTSSIEEDINSKNEIKPKEQNNHQRTEKMRAKEPARANDILPTLYNNNKGLSGRPHKEFDDFDIKDDYEEDFMSGSDADYFPSTAVDKSSQDNLVGEQNSSVTSLKTPPNQRIPQNGQNSIVSDDDTTNQNSSSVLNGVANSTTASNDNET